MSKNQMLKQTLCSLVFCSAGFVWVKGFTSRRRTLLLSICSPVHLWNAPSGLQPFLTEEGPESIRAPTNLTPPSIPHPAGRPFSNRQTGTFHGEPNQWASEQRRLWSREFNVFVLVSSDAHGCCSRVSVNGRMVCFLLVSSLLKVHRFEKRCE